MKTALSIFGFIVSLISIIQLSSQYNKEGIKAFSEVEIRNIITQQKIITDKIDLKVSVENTVKIINSLMKIDYLYPDEIQNIEADIIGHVNIGIDLEDMNKEDVKIKSNEIVVFIPPVKILNCVIDEIYITNISTEKPCKELLKELNCIDKIKKILRDSCKKKIQKNIEKFSKRTEHSIEVLLQRFVNDKRQIKVKMKNGYKEIEDEI